jgi:hypothetical protein
MADYEPKVGECYPQPNKYKTEDWHATHRGKILLSDGKTYYVDCWPEYVSKAGNQMVKIKIGKECPPDNEVARPNVNTFDDRQSTSKGFEDMKDDIPF